MDGPEDAKQDEGHWCRLALPDQDVMGGVSLEGGCDNLVSILLVIA